MESEFNWFTDLELGLPKWNTVLRQFQRDECAECKSFFRHLMAREVWRNLLQCT